MRRCSASLNHQGNANEKPRDHHLTPVRTAVSKGQTCRGGCEWKGAPSAVARIANWFNDHTIGPSHYGALIRRRGRQDPEAVSSLRCSRSSNHHGQRTEASPASVGAPGE